MLLDLGQVRLSSNRKISVGSSPPPVPDWPAWTGATDSADQYFFTTDGGVGPTVVAFQDRNEFVAIVRDRLSPQRRLACVFSITEGDVITKESELALSVGAGGIFPDVIKMTDSRYFAGISQTASGGFAVFYIIGKSGNTLTEVTTTGVVMGYRDQLSFYRLTDTTLVMFYDTDTSMMSVVVDISGDTISFGTPVDTGLSAFRHGAMTVISATEFVVAGSASNADTLFWYTISGSTITQVASLEIDILVIGGGAISDMNGMAVVDNDTVILIYEEDGTFKNIYANTFSRSGGTITRGTRATLAAGTRALGGPQAKKLVALGEGTFMATIVQQELGFVSRQTVIKVDESNIITFGSTVAYNGYYGTLAVIPETNNTKILLVTLDNTTTPTEQALFKVLNGA